MLKFKFGFCAGGWLAATAAGGVYIKVRASV